MNIDKYPPVLQSMQSESDVEQKFVYPLLTKALPTGLGISGNLIRTKPSIQALDIGKGQSKKRYHPDYVVVVAAIPVLIVEVKGPSETLEDATRECRLYACEYNAKYPAGVNPCRYCIISNGRKTELRNWDSDDIVAAFSLEDCNPSTAAFTEFVRLVSYDNLRQVAHAVTSHKKRRQLNRAVNMVGGHSFQDDQIPYNNFGKALAAEYQEIFNPSSYEDREKIVRNAYVKSQRRDRYVEEIDRVIRLSCPPSVRPIPDAMEADGCPGVLSRLTNIKALQNKVLLLVGDVGSGKSTFVDYLQHIVTPQKIGGQLNWIRLDLNKAPVTKEEIYPWCKKRLIEGMKEGASDFDAASLEGMRILYRKEIDDFDQGEGALFNKDSEEYRRRLADLLGNLKRDQDKTLNCLEHTLCTARGKLLLVVLDNCDKRDRDEQLLMFEVARWIQSEIRCLVILPLRHSTFELHKDEPPLDTALKDLIYRIEPPGFQSVLKKRLRLLLKEVKDRPKQLGYDVNGMHIQFSSEQLDRFLGTIMHSLFEHDNMGRRVIFGLAGWNLRKAFEIFLEFCRSGYIEDAEIFKCQATRGSMPLPAGVVSRVLLRTNKRYYNGDESLIKNVFQSNRDDSKPCHFVRVRILAWLENRSRIDGPSGYKGYFPVSNICRDLALLGLDESVIHRECAYLVQHGCILTEHLRREYLDFEDSVAITPAGHVHLDLIENYHYLAACAEDSWLSDLRLCENIHRRIIQEPRYLSFRWPVVLESAKDFLIYLKQSRSQVDYLPDIIASDSVDPINIDYDRLIRGIDAEMRKFREQGRRR